MTRPFEALLKALGETGGADFEYLAARAGRPKPQVCGSLKILIGRGLAERPERGLYRITDAGREVLKSGGGIRGHWRGASRKAPANSLRARLWKAARMTRKFETADLLQLIEWPNEKAAKSGAHKYLMALERSGFIVRLKIGGAPASNGKAPPRWTLIRDTGPRHPQVRRDGGTVHDPNTGEAHPCNG